MERTLSVEEKIKRAEEIYNKRKNPQTTTRIEKINSNNSFIKRKLKKIFIQMSICIIVYVILYSTDFGGTIISQDKVNYIKNFLAQDIDFQVIYKNINEYIEKIIPKENSDVQNNIVNTEEIPESITNTVDETNSNNITNDVNQEVQDQSSNISNDAVQSEENSTSNTDTINNESSIGGAVEVQETSEDTSNEQKTQMELDAEYILSRVSFVKPVENYQISSRFGLRNPTTSSVPKNHTGIDLAAERGTKIVSATDGTVILASSRGDYGNHLKIKIDDIIIVYAHCEKLYVGEGEQVHKGQEIAEVGSSGNSTGPHLHFEVRVSDRVIDPEYVLNFN